MTTIALISGIFPPLVLSELLFLDLETAELLRANAIVDRDAKE
jgi:hypothetical protein